MMAKKDAIDEYQQVIDEFECRIRFLDDKYGVFMSCLMNCEIIASKSQSHVVMYFWRICGSDVSASTGWRNKTPRSTTVRPLRSGEIKRFSWERHEGYRVQCAHKAIDLRQRIANKETNRWQFDTHVDGWGNDYDV